MRSLGGDAASFQLKLQVLDQLRQPFASERVGRLLCQPPDLRKLLFQLSTLAAHHLELPCYMGEVSKIDQQKFTTC